MSIESLSYTFHFVEWLPIEVGRMSGDATLPLGVVEGEVTERATEREPVGVFDYLALQSPA